MSHGAGGKATQSLIEGLLVPAFDNEQLAPLGDAGAFDANGTGLAMTTDSFVVSPLRFPGGSIGDLAVNGTVNDLAVSGAKPLALTLSLILEEGLDTEILRYEIAAVAAAAVTAGVNIISGDTKVVERGLADSLYMCTAGVGHARSARQALHARAAPGRPRDRVRHDRRARHGDHARRAASSSSTRTSSPTPARCGPWSMRCSRRSGPTCAACATPRAAAWPPS